MPKGEIDDQLTFNKKILAAGNEATGAWMRMIALANDQLSDGFLTLKQAATVAPPRVTSRMVDAGLAHRVTDPEPGVVIHDFLKHNRSRADVLAQREAEKKRKAGYRANRGRECPTDVPAGRPLVSQQVSGHPLPLPLPSPLPEEKEERESAPPVPNLTETEREVAEAIDAGEDLWPSLPMTEIAATAKRIVRDVETEPKAAQSGLDAVAATREAVPRARAWAKQRTGANESQRLAQLEVVVGYILADCRAGKRRPPPGPQRLPPSRAGARQ